MTVLIPQLRAVVATRDWPRRFTVIGKQRHGAQRTRESDRAGFHDGIAGWPMRCAAQEVGSG